MENAKGHSSCGCKEIFCCMFSSSRKNHYSHRKQDHYLPASSASTGELEPTHVHVAPDVGHHVHRQSSRSGSDVNEAFSDYINRAKTKIGAMSNVGSDGGEIMYPKADEAYDYDAAEKKADANDVFSDYINRAKLKIRRTSSIGSKRVISFRK